MEHVLCGLILLTRIGDVVSTRLATPTLRLEANPVMRRFGWKLAIVSLLLCLVPYLNPILGVMALVLFSFVCYSNFSRLWEMRAMGEERYEAFLIDAARRTTLVQMLVPTYVGLGFLALIGLFGMAISKGPDEWGFWLSASWLFVAMALAFHMTAFQVRLWRKAHRESLEGA